jgi:hypothetical protein
VYDPPIEPGLNFVTGENFPYTGYFQLQLDVSYHQIRQDCVLTALVRQFAQVAGKILRRWVKHAPHSCMMSEGAFKFWLKRTPEEAGRKLENITRSIVRHTFAGLKYVPLKKNPIAAELFLPSLQFAFVLAQKDNPKSGPSPSFQKPHLPLPISYRLPREPQTLVLVYARWTDDIAASSLPMVVDTHGSLWCRYLDGVLLTAEGFQRSTMLRALMIAS